jgi:8-oxo-dGTP pyrophosphatase MutT (NUDIX family)
MNYTSIKKNANKCGVIVILGNKLLIVQNSRSQLWGFPKGHQESYENTCQGAIRELYEEAGIIASRDDFATMIKKRNWYMYVLYVCDNFVKIDNNEICAYKWVNYANLCDHNISCGTKHYIADLERLLRNNIKINARHKFADSHKKLISI